jgi:hypothetical protein
MNSQSTRAPNAAQQLITSLFEFEDVPSADFKLVAPNEKIVLGVFELAGPEHAGRRALDQARARRMRAEMAKTGNPYAALADRDPEEEEADATEYVISNVLGWRDVVGPDGAPMPYTRDAARALFTNPKLRWVRSKVNEALNERDRFIKRSATS